MSARRYMVIVQDERGYPGAGELSPAPPEGPKPPMLLAAVLEADFEHVEDERDRLKAMLGKVPQELLARIMAAVEAERVADEGGTT